MLYGSILRDGRHALLGIPFEGPTVERAYPSWTMDYVRLDDEDAAPEERETMLTRARTLIPPKPETGQLGITPPSRLRLDA